MSKPIYSLALSVYFKQPKFGMKKHEILSRASAFLLAVDPKTPARSSSPNTQTQFPHLEKSIQEKKEFEVRDNYRYEPAGGPPGRDAKDLNWLEFVPNTFRPIVHVVCSSHVVSPWRFPDYYGQDWIQQIGQEHCKYSLDVIGDNKSLARFACNPYPIHHPQGLDLAIIHLKNEEATLKHMHRLGVQKLYLRDEPQDFKIDEPYLFHGYQITHVDNSLKDLDTDKLTFDHDHHDHDHDHHDHDHDQNEDDRIFIPFQAKGSLKLFSPNRFLAHTDKILPQGLCGGPVLPKQHHDICCGVVEGIVPQTHQDKRFAGSAAFIPSITIKKFIDAAEEFMVKHLVPDHLYEGIVNIKQGKHSVTVDTTQPAKKFDPKQMEKDYVNLTQQLKGHYSPEMYEKIAAFIEKQKKEVIEIADKEGGDLDEIVRKVAEKNYKELQEENEALKKRKLLEDNSKQK